MERRGRGRGRRLGLEQRSATVHTQANSRSLSHAHSLACPIRPPIPTPSRSPSCFPSASHLVFSVLYYFWSATSPRPHLERWPQRLARCSRSSAARVRPTATACSQGHSPVAIFAPPLPTGPPLHRIHHAAHVSSPAKDLLPTPHFPLSSCTHITTTSPLLSRSHPVPTVCGPQQWLSVFAQPLSNLSVW